MVMKVRKMVDGDLSVSVRSVSTRKGERQECTASRAASAMPAARARKALESRRHGNEAQMVPEPFVSQTRRLGESARGGEEVRSIRDDLKRLRRAELRERLLVSVHD